MEKMNMNKVAVAYACDDNYVEQTGISICSLLDNNTKDTKIAVYFVDMGVSEENLHILRELTEGYSQEFIPVSFGDIAWNLNATKGTRHILSVYAKMFLHRIDNKLDRILYIDSDTIICGSLRDLWNTNMDGMCIAASKTVCSKKNKRLLGLEEDAICVNDGIVLMNLEEWRNGDYLTRCLKFIERFGGNPPVLSEGTLNVVCRDKIVYIGAEYNYSSDKTVFSAKELSVLSHSDYYSKEDLDRAGKNPIIVHYVGNMYLRPWFVRSNHPMHHLYDQYKLISPWKEVSYKERPQKTNKAAKIRILHSLLPSRVFLFLYQLRNK